MVTASNVIDMNGVIGLAGVHWQRSIHCRIRYNIVATHASHLLSQTDSRQSVTTQSVLDVNETNLVPADCSSFGKRRSYSFICHSLSLFSLVIVSI